MSNIKVQVQTPSEKIIQKEKSALPESVIDADGKIYKLRLPDPSDQLDLSAALGDFSANIGVLVQVMPLLYIEKINDQPFFMGSKYNEIRAALKVVGRNGMKVVSDVVNKFLMAEKEEMEEPSNLKK